MSLLLYQKYDDQYYYVEVESNYIEPTEGKDQDDAVNIFMGIMHPHTCEVLINVSTDEARQFAKSILGLCNEIDNIP